MQLELVETSRFNRRFRVALGDATAVEAVHYRDEHLCVSSQVGCAVRCPFCASGQRGLKRGLLLEELVGQVRAVRELGLSVRRVTVSGVGEPLHNFAAVRAFLAWCREQGIAPSVTTSGGPLPRLRELLHAPHNGLTLSVHAGSEPVRRRLVPGGPPLAELFACLTEELPKLSHKRRKKTALAYLALAGENDSAAELDAFAALAAPTGLAVHLYALNRFEGQGAAAVDRARYEWMWSHLRAAGLRVRMSSQARLEANGGCGTLVALPVRSSLALAPHEVAVARP